MSWKESRVRRSLGILRLVLTAAFILAACAPSRIPETPTATQAPTAQATATPVQVSNPPGGLDQTSITYDFEDGTTQGWGPRGDGVSVGVATDTAHSGSNSILVSKRTQNWHGAAIDVKGTLEPDTTYEIGAYVKLAKGAPKSRVILTMQRKPAGGETKYEWIAPSAEDGVTDAEWVELKGQYSYSGDVEELLLYVESPDAELVDFYIDDITITSKASQRGSLGEYDFEDGTTQGWRGRGDAKVSVATDVAHGGSNSLLVTDRTQNWNGAIIDVMNLLKPGTYEISGFVKLAKGEPPSRVILTMQRTPKGGDTKYEWIAPSAEDGVTDADWVELKGQYTYSGDVSELLLYVESPDAELVDFYIDDIKITAASQPEAAVQADIPSLYQTLSDYFPVGAAVDPDQLDSPEHAELLTRHFNSVTPENQMKPGPIQPSEGNFQWAGADKLVTFAKEHNLAVHGHTLVWHSQAAEWMFEDSSGKPLEATPENKTLVLKRLETHIREVVGRYKDAVNVWDVVNEVIDENQQDCMRRSRWYELTGTEYITTAFKVAHELDPDAALLINDYNLEQPAKRTCMHDFVQLLLKEGVPVSGIGTQLHVNIESPSAEAIEKTIETFASLGVKVHVTELDVSLYTDDTSSLATIPEQLLVKQGYRYRDIFDVLKRQAKNIGSVTFWGMADDHTWLKTFPIARLNLPLLFDEQLQAKPAFWGIVDPSKLRVLIQQATASQGTPAIDGKAEAVWDTQSWTDLQTPQVLPVARFEMHAQFKSLWDEGNLYLLVNVIDVTKDPGDQIEIFVDQNASKSKAPQADDLHFTCQRSGSCGPTENIQASVQATKDGYLLEAALKLDGSLHAGQPIGFDLRVTDGDEPDAPALWNDLSNSQDKTPANFGTLVLAEALRLTTAVRGTPVIDGEEDPVWAQAKEISTDVWVLGDKGSTAKVKTLWDSDHLYVYAVVTDSKLSKASANVWEQDSIEVFLDQNNARTTSYEADDAQYRVNFDNEQSFNGDAKAELIKSATKVVPGGYVVELAIQLDVVKPADGVQIGFDFQVNNDEDGDGVRDSVAIWQDPTGQSYQNTSKFGVLQFVSK